ncbi:phospholipase [Metapseudomonas boanensis]|uniref:Phospholipase n=1 Tax=Metapseudomonas boanensis TaxID=2822138 RepID=A0ABS5XD83_9GAMM|nr:phospholipase [Pseudomonas boanensis]MBT8765648.1 phospholipase [Pseudomonas boanensis]
MNIRYDIVVPIALQHTRTATLTSPWFVQKTEYPPMLTDYRYLINGEATFKAVHEAIEKAQASIDIICWGFQPSMYFIRDGQHPALGKLLEGKARQGVRVRILGWEMPLNAAGLGGEANLPGKSPNLKHRAGQTAADEQHREDERWFDAYAVSDGKAAQRVNSGVPVFVSRGFSMSERDRIEEDVRQHSLDRELSGRTIAALKWAPTHHQKSVLVDYELPEQAVGFVMGHNMLDEYWDTDTHSARKRPAPQRPNAETHAPDRGPRGALPRQDISCRVTGPILEHLHQNFADAWQKETGEDLLAARQGMAQGRTITFGAATLRVPYTETADAAGESTPLLAQLLRTQAQTGAKDIQSAYLQAVNNATQFIYIENQYFRWPPLAEAIKKAAADQTGAGRDPGLHGALHLFVITNVTDDGIGAGTVNTQRMLEILGRTDTIPKVTKLRRIERVKNDMPPRPRPDGPNDQMGQRELAAWKAKLERKTQQIEAETLVPEEIPGLKVHVCSLVAPDSPPGAPWMPVYIHSKLMIVNDVFTTHGSANINTRSMMVDSELNIAHEWYDVTRKMRRELFELHTGGKGAQDDPKQAFDAWTEIIERNKDLQSEKLTPKAPVIAFHYDQPTMNNLD